ncbi:MAG: hypothetical protein FJ387_10805 [Verrucomicrobia bacterium]|nr:hypothetical protein [Verrucomicrobiota bacterium]
MGFLHWLDQNWFVLLQSAGIVGGLVFTAVSLRIDAKVRRVGNLIAITHEHRDIWTQLYKRPDLARVLDPAADLTKNPVTSDEQLFVTLLILHLASVHAALESGMLVQLQGLRKDVGAFFRLPIPAAVWNDLRWLQDDDFVRFVQACTTNR